MAILQHEQAIFEAARAIGPRTARDAYLHSVGPDDTQLGPRIRALLRAYEQNGDFLESPAVLHALPTSSDLIGTTLGHYTIRQSIGEGGMGTVYLAEQTEPFARQVALKVIKPGMDSRQVIARFEAERQTLALMDHGHIARVLDAGTTPAGRPYFVMELVQGVPITQYCDEHKLTIRQRVELFMPVCRAIQHAHQKGIIHRDVKPTNVLIAQDDGRPMPKVIDFGIAKAIEHSPTDATQHGTLVGTLDYMSPEQAEMGATGIDTRSDIYSLGALLYELLTGRPPLPRDDHAYGESLRRIREVEPPAPSARLKDTQPAQARLLRGELDWIVRKCLEKDRNRRYETASDLAADLQRYLTHQPVQASPPSARYRVRKFVLRNRAAVLAASLFALLLLGGIVGTTWQAVRATNAERQARENEQHAVAEKEKAQANFQLAKQAVDKYLSAVGGNPKLGEHDFFPLRKELLETAIPFYRQFVQERSDDPNLEAARGRAFGRLADVRDTMGERAGALADYDAMRAIFAKLAAEHPDVPAYRVDLARSELNRGLVLVALGQYGEGESSYRSALALREQLTRQDSGNLDHRWSMASIQSSLGLVYRTMKRFDESEAAFRSALTIQKELAPAYLHDPSHRRSLAMIHTNLGILLKSRERYAEAEAAHLDARKIFEQLVAEFPKAAAYRSGLATSQNNLANALRAQGKSGEADVASQSSITLQKQLVAGFPSVPEYRLDLAMYHVNRGIALKNQKQPIASEAEYRTAIAIGEQLVAEFPVVARYAMPLGNNYRNLGVSLKTRGHHQDSLEWLSKAIAIFEPLHTIEPWRDEARPRLSQSHWSRGDALDVLKRYDEALRDWDRAIALDDGSNKARYESRREQTLQNIKP